MPRASRLDKPLPWYRWTPVQWQASRKVAKMNWAEKGLYRELMDECWLKGSIPSNAKEIAALVDSDKAEIEQLMPAIIDCFVMLPDGSLMSEHIEVVRAEAMVFRQAQADRKKAKDTPPPPTAAHQGEPTLTGVVHDAPGLTVDANAPPGLTVDANAPPGTTAYQEYSTVQYSTEKKGRPTQEDEHLQGTSVPPALAGPTEGQDEAEAHQDWELPEDDFEERDEHLPPLEMDPLEPALRPFSAEDQKMLLDAEATVHDLNMIGELMRNTGGTLDDVHREAV